MPPNSIKPLRWYRCVKCGWEHEICAMYQECGDCRSGDLHIISNVDGEMPKRLTTGDGRSTENPSEKTG